LLVARLASLIFKTHTSIRLLQGMYMDQTCLIKAHSGYGKPFRLSRKWLKNELKKNYVLSQELRNCNHHLHLSVNKVSTENQLVIFRLCCNRCGSFFCAIKKQYALNVFKLEQIPEQNMEKYFKMQTDASNYRLKLNEKTYEIYNASWDFNTNQQYNEYLTTEEWHNKRRLVLNRCNYICEACLINRAVQAHHLTYENIYNENLFELVGVCIPCHKKIHNLYSDKETFDTDGSDS
jgi:hypothetical protein